MNIMKVEELTVIGERINASLPQVETLLREHCFDGLAELAADQARAGARAIDINVGTFGVEVMTAAVRAVREAVAVPVSIDSDDPARLRAGLLACAGNGAGELKPLLNSVTWPRAGELLPLRAVQPCGLILLLTERPEGERIRFTRTAGEALAAAGALLELACEHGYAPEDLYFDPGLPPAASDLDGRLTTVLEVLAGLQQPAFAGTHRVLGISNLTHHLPSGVRLEFQNAFLTLAAGKGLDTIIGDPARAYRTLAPGDPVLALLERLLGAEGIERLTILQELYR